jgi:hypothetical protein
MNNVLKTAAIAAIAGLIVTQSTDAQIVARNSGSLGALGDGTHSANVTLNTPGAVAAGGDLSVGYFGISGSTAPRTTVPYLSALNPPASSPFTVEFWANPEAEDLTGPCPLFNRISDGNRSGWVFFQRGSTIGWNFRMYDGNGTNLGVDLTGGANSPGLWSHVVAVWNGTAAVLYVDGVLVDDTNDGSGTYNPNTGPSAPTFTVGSYDIGDNAFHGSVDEVAFYPTALTPAQILAHFNTAASPVPGAYASLVLADGAIEYLQMPEPSAATLLLVGLAGCGTFKRHRRR